MTVVLEKGATFLNVPLVTVRDLLAGCYKHGVSPWRLEKAKGLSGVDAKTLAVLLSELTGLGLLDEKGLTEAGKGLAFATARSRTPREKARPVLDEFLRSCSLVNARKSLPFKIKDVWLFGSMLDPARETVGDVDVAMEVEWPKGRGRDVDLVLEKLALKLGGNSLVASSGLMREGNIERFVLDRVLHGARRNPLLSIQQGLGVMASLGCSCMKVFDIDQGGRIKKPEPLDHHPSWKPSSSVRHRRTMPDLTLTNRPISPVSSELVNPGGHDYDRVRERFRHVCGLDKSTKRLVDFDHFSEDVERRTNRWDSNIDGETALRLFGGRRNFDGVRGSGVIVSAQNDWREMVPALGVVLQRSIEAKDDVVEVIYDVVDARPSGAAPAVMAEGVVAAAWWAQDLASVDIEAILRRDLHEDIDRSIRIGVRGGGAAGHLVARYLQRSLETVIDEVHDKVCLLRHPDTTVIGDPEVSLGLRP